MRRLLTAALSATALLGAAAPAYAAHGPEPVDLGNVKRVLKVTTQDGVATTSVSFAYSCQPVRPDSRYTDVHYVVTVARDGSLEATLRTAGDLPTLTCDGERHKAVTQLAGPLVEKGMQTLTLSVYYPTDQDEPSHVVTVSTPVRLLVR